MGSPVEVRGLVPRHVPHVVHEEVEVVEGSSGDQMRERYEQLKLLRVTQPEREAAAARKALEKVTSSSDELVASLRAQLAAAQGQGGDGSSEKSLRAENADLRKRLEAAEDVDEADDE